MKPTLALVATLSALLAACTSAPTAPVAAPAATAVAAHAETCKATSEAEITALFDRWNQSLQSGDPHKVSANYAEGSLLLPTVSNTPRYSAAEKEDYFHHFLENKPVGHIDARRVFIGCNTAVDAGLYTFTFAKTGAQVHARYSYTYKWDGSQWLITTHHSSGMPEKG